MSLQERVYSVLIVSAAGSFPAAAAELLPPSRYSPVRVAASCSEAKRELSSRTFDLILINSPLPDESGDRFAIDCCRSQTSVVLLLTRAEAYEELHDRVMEHGVFTLSKPVSRASLTRALDWMATARERLRQSEQKSGAIEQRMEEIRRINRAKLLLISLRGMSEPEAHRYIERSAMDHCIPKRDAAELIIRSLAEG